MTAAEFSAALSDQRQTKKGTDAISDYFNQIGWPEGDRYTYNENYTRLTAHPVLVNQAAYDGLIHPAKIIEKKT